MATTRPGEMTIHYDVRYARAGGKDLLFPLFLPPAKSPRPSPLVVFIHGGAWREADRWWGARFAQRMVRRGFAYASISHRLSQEAVFPAQIEDCKAAIRFFRANAGRFRIDPERIGVWGTSAGGHLAALLGTAGHVKEFDRSGGNLRVSSRVQAVCDCCGPTDFLQLDAHALPNPEFVYAAPDSPTSLLLGAPTMTVPERCAQANPIAHIRGDDCPPFLILHGAADSAVPAHQSRLLHDALLRAGVESTLRVVEGAGHRDVAGRPELVEAVERFFDRHLRRRRGRTPRR
jgi:acetyl esterase/lipase